MPSRRNPVEFSFLVLALSSIYSTKLRVLVSILLSLVLLTIPGFLFGQTRDSVLEIAVYDSPPFGYRSTDGKTYGGIMVELWEDIAKDLEFSYRYHLTDMEGLLSGLENKEFDLALGAISITPNREDRVDFTQAVNPSGTGIAVAAGTWRNKLEAVWKPIFLSLVELIGIVLLLLFISALLVWIAERKNRPETSEKGIHNLADGFWWAAVTMTTVGYGDKVPSTKMGKAIGILWIFVGIVLFSLFTANASAIFTTKRLESHIDSVEALKRNTVGAVRNSSGAEFLDRQRVAYLGFENMEDILDALLDGEIDCVVNNVPVLRFYNNQPNYFGKLAISNRLLLKNNMGIALQENSPLREEIDLVLLEKISETKWQQTLYRYLGED